MENDLLRTYLTTAANAYGHTFSMVVDARDKDHARNLAKQVLKDYGPDGRRYMILNHIEELPKGS